MTGIVQSPMLHPLLFLWNNIISSGNEREVYEISEDNDAWHNYDVSTLREESRKELNTLNHEEDLSSD